MNSIIFYEFRFKGNFSNCFLSFLEKDVICYLCNLRLG